MLSASPDAALLSRDIIASTEIRFFPRWSQGQLPSLPQVFEALLGAICQDAGYDGVRAFLQRHWPLPQHHDQLRKEIQRAGLWPQLKRYQFGWDEATILEQNPEALQDVPASIRDAPSSKR